MSTPTKYTHTHTLRRHNGVTACDTTPNNETGKVPPKMGILAKRVIVEHQTNTSNTYTATCTHTNASTCTRAHTETRARMHARTHARAHGHTDTLKQTHTHAHLNAVKLSDCIVCDIQHFQTGQG